MQPVDVLILSNGPGELLTWVRPVVKCLRERITAREALRISVVLSPCPHATGKEAQIARQFPEVDRVQAAKHFFRFLVWGKTAENWDWRDRGVVVFLGGDQFFPVLIGKRLGYRTVVYAEWEARWQRWIDRFAVMKPEILNRTPQTYRHKLTVVGDLIADAQTTGETSEPASQQAEGTELIGLLPGSKPAKLMQGLPLELAIAEFVHRQRPQTRFVIPVAPTLDLQTLARYADPQQNPVIPLVEGTTAELVAPKTSGTHILKTASGLPVELHKEFPAYDLLSRCHLCITTVGANTAELGTLGIPMVVILPTQQLDAMRAWDGIPGVLANLPGVGASFAKLINWWVLRQKRLFAWPNIWAQAEIVPELVGQLQPDAVAKIVLDLLENPQKRLQMRSRLLAVRGQPGAAAKIAGIVAEQLGL